MTTETIHTCSYECLRPECIRAQRDELAARLTVEANNARGEVVAWFPTNAQGEIIRNYGDGSPVYACRTKEEAEQARRCHLGATGPVVPLYASPPPAAEGVQAEPRPVLSEPDRIGLYQGPDDCPQLMVNDRPVAIFPAGSWAKVCDALDSITGSVQPDPKPEARGGVDDLIHAASNAATIIRNCVNAREIGEGYAQHADDIDAAIAALAAQQPAAVDGDVVSEYIAARDAYEAATRPPNSHAPARQLKHGDPIMLRYRQARAALAALHQEPTT